MGPLASASQGGSGYMHGRTDYIHTVSTSMARTESEQRSRALGPAPVKMLCRGSGIWLVPCCACCACCAVRAVPCCAVLCRAVPMLFQYPACPQQLHGQASNTDATAQEGTCVHEQPYYRPPRPSIVLIFILNPLLHSYVASTLSRLDPLPLSAAS